MGRKLGLTADDVVRAATDIADDAGIEALSVAAVAEALGVRSPSLYHWFAGLAELRRAVALRGASSFAKALADAAQGREGADALVAVAHAYRKYARLHPGQLAAMLPAPRRSEDEELYVALSGPVSEVARVLAQLGVSGDDAIHAIRVLRSFLHGFIDLERARGFGMPHDIDTSFARGLEILIAGLPAVR